MGSIEGMGFTKIEAVLNKIKETKYENNRI